MDTSGRPRKRIRPTYNESGKSTADLQYFHRSGSFKVHQGGEGSYEEILSYLQASTFIEAALARKLHKQILVNLGFSLKLERIEETILLAECLRALYRCTWSRWNANGSPKSAESYFGLHEVEEAFVMMLQALEGLKEKPSMLSTSSSTLFKGTCLQIIHQLMIQSPGLRQMIGSSRNLLEAILYVIVSMPKPSQSQHEESSYMGIFPMLRSMSPTAMQLTTIADSIMFENHNRVQHLLGSSKEDQVFYMNCLLIDGAPERCMKDSGLYEAISFTKEACLEENHLSSAVDCFRRMIDKSWSMAIDSNRFFELLVEVLLERPKSNGSSTRVTVNCFELLVGTEKTRDMLLELSGFSSVVQFLSNTVFHESESKDTVQKSTDVLCSIAIALQESPGCKTKEMHDPFRFLLSLLSSDHPEVFNKTVACIHTLLKSADETRLTNDDCRNLISLLAETSLQAFTPNEAQHNVVEVFRLLAQQDETCLNFLTRQPSALSLLVRVASDEKSIAPRRRAISLLLQLSKNPCNHRILARQHGLLAAFFHYMRGANESDDQREKVKEQTLHLAKSL